MKQYKAKIRWFDGMSGEGMVRVEGIDKSIYLHFTAIEGINKNNHQWPTEEDQIKLGTKLNGKSCLVELVDDTTFVGISKCILVEEL